MRKTGEYFRLGIEFSFLACFPNSSFAISCPAIRWTKPRSDWPVIRAGVICYGTGEAAGFADA